MNLKQKVHVIPYETVEWKSWDAPEGIPYETAEWKSWDAPEGIKLKAKDGDIYEKI